MYVPSEPKAINASFEEKREDTDHPDTGCQYIALSSVSTLTRKNLSIRLHGLHLREITWHDFMRTER